MPPTPEARTDTAPAEPPRVPADQRMAALLLGTTMFAVWSWWALAHGAFFGTVMLPGAILIYLVLIVVICFSRLPIATRGPHVVALLALAGLAAWIAISVLWSPAKDLAVDYAGKAAIYAAAFALGLAFTTALRHRIILSATPLLAAGAVVAAVVIVVIWSSDELRRLVDYDGTLDFPFGYRNANAGFFIMVAVAALPVIARPRSGVPTKAALSALGAVSLSLAVMSQSRGSLLAVAAGILIVLVASPNRVRATVATLVVAIPVAIVLSQLLDAFDAAGTASALDDLQRAATAAVVAGGLAAALSATLSAIEWQGRGVDLPKPSKPAALAIAGAILVCGSLLVVAVAGNPITSITDRLDSISSADEDYGEITGSRFTYSGGLNRVDFWEVALDQGAESPVVGGGAGSFRSAYLANGDGKEAPRNAHSLPLEVFGELGLVGAFLLLIGFVAAVWAALRSRRLGPECAALTAVALAVTASVLAQAFVDWSWYFGALMAPAIALLGSAAAPAALALRPLSRGVRFSGAAIAALLAAVAVPAYASERLSLEAARNWRGDTSGAFVALSRAADLNPFATTPLLVESEIARLSGDDARAVAAAREASDRAPDDWRGYMLAAQALANDRPQEALIAIDRALELNPNSDEVARLRSRILSENRE